MSNEVFLAIKNTQAAQAAEPKLKELKKATDGFEEIFMKKLFSQMRSSVKETQFGESFGKDIYNDMFDEALAKSAAKSGALGMGDMLYKQFAPRIVAQTTQDLEQQAKVQTRLHIDLTQKDSGLEGRDSIPSTGDAKKDK